MTGKMNFVLHVRDDEELLYLLFHTGPESYQKVIFPLILL